jgi:hypothetical protein
MGDRDRMADIPLRFLRPSHGARAVYARIGAATLASVLNTRVQARGAATPASSPVSQRPRSSGWMLVSRAMQGSAAAHERRPAFESSGTRSRPCSTGLRVPEFGRKRNSGPMVPTIDCVEDATWLAAWGGGGGGGGGCGRPVRHLWRDRGHIGPPPGWRAACAGRASRRGCASRGLYFICPSTEAGRGCARVGEEV